MQGTKYKDPLLDRVLGNDPGLQLILVRKFREEAKKVQDHLDRLGEMFAQQNDYPNTLDEFAAWVNAACAHSDGKMFETKKQVDSFNEYLNRTKSWRVVSGDAIAHSEDEWYAYQAGWNDGMNNMPKTLTPEQLLGDEVIMSLNADLWLTMEQMQQFVNAILMLQRRIALKEE